MKNRRIINFLTAHFTLIQTLIFSICLIGWKMIANTICHDFTEANQDIDLVFIFIELLYILIILEGIFYPKDENKRLRKRPPDLLRNYFETARHDIFISGIINNSVVNFFMSNEDLLRDCLNRNIKIRLLFYVSDNEQCLNWYLKMMYGFKDHEGKIKNDKRLYGTQLNIMKDYQMFKMLSENNLLEIRRLNSPVPTAFVAKDIQIPNANSQVQCLFYQFMINSPDCPAYIIDDGEEMFETIKETISDMWDNSNEDLQVSYISGHS